MREIIDQAIFEIGLIVAGTLVVGISVLVAMLWIAGR